MSYDNAGKHPTTMEPKPEKPYDEITYVIIKARCQWYVTNPLTVY